MKKKNLQWIIICNILGVVLFLSWYITQFSGFWFEVDKAIFYGFNQMLTTSKAFMYFVAFINLRAFDIVAFVAMLAIFIAIIVNPMWRVSAGFFALAWPCL